MIKKILVAVLAGLIVTNSYAIKIINKNSKTIKYQIGIPVVCGDSYSHGEISRDGETTWNRLSLYHPDRVCVRVTGWTSMFGAFAFNVKNDTCVLTVEDSGALRGVKLEYGSGC